MKALLLVTACLSFFILSNQLSAAIRYVDDDALNDPGPGDPTVSDPLEDGSAAHPYDAIQEGIDAAVDGVDDVYVEEGIYTGVGNKDLDFDEKAIEVIGVNGAATTIIDCEGAGRGFNFISGENETSLVMGFTIRNGLNGSLPGDGGGIYCFDSSPSIRNCIITGNEAHYGGGISCANNSDPGIYNCIITGNTATQDGGGLVCYSNSSPEIVNCTITGNEALRGGGISSDNSSATLVDCILWGNSAEEIYVRRGAPPTVEYCDVREGTGEAWFGVGCIDADPGFMYAVGGNYRLRPGSPCIDAGRNQPTAPFHDIEGRSRYDDPTTPNTGGGPLTYHDIGAHEFKGYYVNDGAGGNLFDGLAPVWDGLHGPKLTIQAAIDAAADGDAVVVASEIYTGAGNKDLDFNGKTISLLSENGAAVTIIDCEGAGRGFYFHSGETATAFIDGFTIRGGSPGDAGGGIRCLNSSPTIANSAIIGNEANLSGGGINLGFSDMIMVNCTIAGNTASGTPGIDYGGGIACWSSNPTIRNCAITGNEAESGGGIFCSTSSPELTNCTVAYNSTMTGFSGGFYLFDSSPRLTNCILWGDIPSEIYVVSGAPTTEYCDIQDGTGEAWFGAGCIDSDPNFIYAAGDDVRLRPGSPCIDAGISTDAPVEDIDARARYDDPMTSNTGSGALNYYDMGAHEFKGYYANNVTGNDAWDGLAPEWDGVHGPKLTIQAGLDTAGDGDSVNVASGTYTGAGNRDLDFAGKAIALLSENGAVATIIDCDATAGDRHRGFAFQSNEGAASIIVGFTITNAYAPVNGGAIYCSYSSPTILNCIISGNYAPYDSGGLFYWGSSPATVNCAIIGNSAGRDGAAIGCFWNSAPEISNCTIAGNSTGNTGGGIYCENSNPELTNCILWGDGPEEVFITSGSPTFEYSDIQDGTGEVWFGAGCIDDDPLFVTGLSGDYYLSHAATGQPSDSPCVDTGSDTAANLGLDHHTTRTDGIHDEGTVDMGYHAPYILRIDTITRSGNDITILWNAIDGVSYTVQHSDDMEAWNDVPTGQTNTWTDTDGALESQRYYRVREQ